ncbi:MAG: hypothetical protein JRJ65_00985 [Deltaproteobacteria bacterium]|nr:hypothetical protein [Deltaproteobacteria bacterium]
MQSLITPIEILNKSNCKECMAPTCLAFAAAVFTGRKQLQDCQIMDKCVFAYRGVRMQGRLLKRPKSLS